MISCFIQSCLFVQCWPWIFLVQCWQNLNNVGVAFAATSYYQKIAKKCPEQILFSCDIFCPTSIKTKLHGIPSWPKLSRVSKTSLHKVFTCVMLSQENWGNTEPDFFLWIVVWSLNGNIAQGFYLCNVVTEILRQY